MATLTLPNVTHVSFVLLPHVPCDYHSTVCISLQKSNTASPSEFAHRGIVVPAQIDNDESDWLMGHPTVYLRVRPDQRWVLAILPFPVEKTATRFQGMPCEVLLSSECVNEIDRESLMKQFESHAFLFNQSAVKHIHPFSLDAIASIYRAALQTFAKTVLFQGGFDSHKVGLTLEMINMYAHCAEAAVPFAKPPLPSDEDILCTGSVAEPTMPPGIVDTLSNELPLVQAALSPAKGHAETHETASRIFPGYDLHNRLAIEESMQLCGNKGFTPTLFINASPISVRHSGYLIYYPLPKSIDILSMGVNADERRQGYAYQLLMHLACMYPNAPIQMIVKRGSIEANLLFGVGANFVPAKEGGYLDAIFTYENFFPVERNFLKSFQSVERKFRKRRKK